MDVHRIGGIKYDLDRLSKGELENIHGHLLETHARLIGEVSLIEFKLLQHRNNPLPLPEDEISLGSYAEIADVLVWEAYTEATRDL